MRSLCRSHSSFSSSDSNPALSWPASILRRELAIQSQPMFLRPSRPQGRYQTATNSRRRSCSASFLVRCRQTCYPFLYGLAVVAVPLRRSISPATPTCNRLHRPPAAHPAAFQRPTFLSPTLVSNTSPRTQTNTVHPFSTDNFEDPTCSFNPLSRSSLSSPAPSSSLTPMSRPRSTTRSGGW